MTMILCDTALYSFQFLRIAKSGPKCDKWLDIARSARSWLKGLDHVTELAQVTEHGSELIDTP